AGTCAGGTGVGRTLSTLAGAAASGAPATSKPMRTRADRTDLRTNNSSLTDRFTWYYRRLTGRDGAAPGSCWPAGFEAPSPRRSHPAGLRRMTVVQAPRQRVAGHLHQLHQHDEDDD